MKPPHMWQPPQPPDKPRPAAPLPAPHTASRPSRQLLFPGTDAGISNSHLDIFLFKETG